MHRILTIFIFSALLNSCKHESLPSVNIKREGGIGWNAKEPCRIIYALKGDTIELPANIKYRGGMSSKYYKHSFALELEKKYGLCGLPVDDDWILNANYIDKTFMRHKISYDLFREMNSKNIAAKCSYANVLINDKYEGLYVIMQEVNASMIGLDKSDSLAVLFKDPPIFSKGKLSWVKDSLNYYQQKFPKINTSNKTEILENFKNFLFESDDSDFAKQVSTWVDIENVIDWHLMLLFSNNSDGVVKNFFLYKLNGNTPFRFAIWDYDHSFGRDGDNELNLMQSEVNCNRAILLERLTQIPETDYLSKLKKRWFELRNLNIISLKNLKNLISQNDKRIMAEVGNNTAKWPIDSKWYYDNNDYQQELDLMLEFADIRIDQLDEYFGSL